MALKKSQLYSSLWQSCDELRGGMDASQYKDYVLTLLFMKYVSDRYAGRPHAVIVVPEGGGFADMVKLKGDKEIGDRINKIIGNLAEANDLKGVIDQADFNDAAKLGAGKEMQDRLSKLVAIFEGLDLSANRAGGDDLLGDAYEYLMRHFATESGKSKGQFYTPAEVSRIMAKVIGVSPETRPDQTIYDPTCGSGSLLLKAADEAPNGITLYGQEMDNATWALARMNMFLHGHPTAELWRGNTLADPYYKNPDGGLKTFDFAVANPPFSAKAWSSGLDPNHDEFRRFEYGIPPVRNGDYAFLLHLVASLRSKGKGAIILPHGVLFRGNREADIRRNLVRRGLVKGIIGLPPNLFYGTGIPACIVVIDKEDAHARTGIFMIDASRGFVKDGNKNRLRAQDIHTYKYDEAVADGVVLDLRYEARDIDQNITSEAKIDQWFEAKTRGLTDLASAQLKQRWGTMRKVLSSRERLSKIVADILLDMETRDRLKSGRGNALLVSDSIYSACRLFEMFQGTELADKCAIVTSYKPAPADIKGEETGEGLTERLRKYDIYRKMLATHFHEPEEAAMKKIEVFEKEVKKRFVDEPARMKLLIVVDKLLTGFDAPSATCLYIDKHMQDHGLFQAICRVNRLDGEDKEYGYVIDYKDLFRSLEKSVQDYTGEAFDGYDAEDVQGLLKDRLQQGRERLEEAREAVKALCEPVDPPRDSAAYRRCFCAAESGNAQELKDNEPKRVALYKLVAALVRAYANLANEMDAAGYNEAEAREIKAEVSHFEKVREEIKLASGDYIDLKLYEPAMRHLLDTYIRADDSESLSEFEDMTLVELIVERGKDGLASSLPERIRRDPEAMAETIENNVRRIVIDEMAVNPKYYERMSKLLDNLILQRRQESLAYKDYLDRIVALTKGYAVVGFTGGEGARPRPRHTSCQARGLAGEPVQGTRDPECHPVGTRRRRRACRHDVRDREEPTGLLTARVELKGHRIDVGGTPVEVVRKDIKNLHVGVYPPSGRVRVAAPLHLDDDAVRLAVISRLGWIRRRQAEFERQDRQSQREFVTGESHFFEGRQYRLDVVERHGAPAVHLLNNTRMGLQIRPGADRDAREAVLHRWYRRQLRNRLPPLVAKWEPKVGGRVADVRIRKMKTRWGACNPDARRVWLNLELAKKPPSCLEYVLVHEMVHLIERTHSERFRSLMDDLMPLWRTRRDELNQAPLAHEDWTY